MMLVYVKRPVLRYVNFNATAAWDTLEQRRPASTQNVQ